MIKVSVVMAAYNAEKFIQQAIDSVLEQSVSDFELIIVNDGSTDRTGEVISKYSDQRVRYFELKRNQGIANARNFALSKVRSEYVAFIDSDDVWERNKLMSQLQFMNQNNLDFSYTYYQLITENGDPFRTVDNLRSSADYKSLLKSNYIPFLTVIMRSRLIKKEGFIDTHHEDYATWLQIFRNNNGINVKLLPKITANYRVRKNSVSANKLKSLWWSWSIYRVNESMSWLKSMYYLIFNVWYGLYKHYF